MKTKTMWMLVLAAALGATAGWLAPRPLLAAGTAAPSSRKVLYYTCPMHPTVKLDKPGACPICGMNLVPVYETPKTNSPAAASTNQAVMMPGCCGGGGCQ